MTSQRIVYQGHLYVVAQDPPAEDPLAETPPAGDAPPEAEPDLGAGGEEEKADPEEMIKEIKDSPAANWEERYLQPIIQDLKVRFGLKPHDKFMSLRGTEITSETGDYDLGFYITGYVSFASETPAKVHTEFGDSPIHFKVFVDGDGVLHRENIDVYTEAP